MKNGDKPAYPAMDMNSHLGVDRLELRHEGSTKREAIAAAALQGILANRELQLCLLKDVEHDGTTTENCYAVFAVKQADELLKQLES